MKKLFRTLPGIFFIFIFFSWFYVSTDWYVCSIFNKCKTDSVSLVSSSTQKDSEHFEKIYFLKDSTQIYLSDNINSSYSIISNMSHKKQQKFNITGLYFSDEDESIGLGRARSAKELLKQYPWYDQITIKSKKVNTTFKNVKYSKYNSAILFNIDNQNDSFKVIGQNIHFGFNESTPQKSLNIKQYLNSIAHDFKNNKINQININGHTDNKGNSFFNQSLGLKRAKMIKEMLVSIGVKPAIIKTQSYGDTKPAETNSTDEGRYLNRRVELIIK